MGIRSSTPEMAGLVRRLLGEHFVAHVVAPPTLTLLSTAEDNTFGRGLWLVYRSQRQIARRRTEAGALRSLLGQLEVLARAQDDRHPHFDATILASGDRIVIGPPILRVDVSALRAGLRRSKWLVTDTPGAWLDPAGRALVRERAVRIDDTLLPELDARRPPELPILAPGTYRIAGWLTFYGEQPAPSRARVAASYAGAVDNLEAVGSHAALAAIAAAVESATVADLATMDAPEIVAQLDRF